MKRYFELAQIVRQCEDGTNQILITGDREKLTAIWYDLLEIFPYDVRDTSNEHWKESTHNISIQQVIPPVVYWIEE